MTFEDEVIFLEQFKEKVEKGMIIEAKGIKEAYEKSLDQVKVMHRYIVFFTDTDGEKLCQEANIQRKQVRRR